MFTQSGCGEALELEGRQFIINTALHLACHLNGIHQKQRVWLDDCRKRVRGCEGIPSHGEPHKLYESMKARPVCMSPRVVKD
jgi:hypothetical protein